MNEENRHIADRLTSFVDGVLSASERDAILRHLADCPACRRAVALEEGGRAILRAKAADLRSGPLPPGLRSHCEAHLRTERSSAAASWWRWHGTILPVSAAIVIAVVSAGVLLFVANRRSNTLFAAQLTADHVRCIMEVAGPEPASADARRLESLLSEQYGWNVRVPPSSPDGNVQLVGTRRCLAGDGVVPHLVYRTSGKDVSLYMIEGDIRDETEVETLGYRARVWSRGNTTFVLVSPADAGPLTSAVEYLKQEAY